MFTRTRRLSDRILKSLLQPFCQPLQGLALLTDTHETKGLGSVAVGLKAQATRHVGLRFEVRDLITPFPRKVIAEAPGAKISGLLHDIVIMGGIAILF